MHVVFRESHGLEETETPTDLGQTPGDLVVLSLSDSDLGALAEGWRQGGGKRLWLARGPHLGEPVAKRGEREHGALLRRNGDD